MSWLVAAAFVFFGCNAAPQGGDTGTPDADVQTAAPAAAGQGLFMVRVDNLRLRKEPNRQAGVVAQLREGSFVQGTGEVTSFRDTATLRGRFYEEPYYRVGTDAGEQGYAFGGGLLLVYAGTATGSPDRARLSQYADQLKALPAQRIESAGEAIAAAGNLLGAASPALADAIYVLLDDYLYSIQWDTDLFTQVDEIPWQDSDYEAVYEGRYPMDRHPVTRALAANGFALATAEGSIFPVKDQAAIDRLFRGKTSPAMTAYLDLELEEFRTPSMSEGGILIPIGDFARRALAWEQLATAYPDFVMHEMAVQRARWEAFTLLGGADNSPASDYETGRLYPEFAQAWQEVLAKAPKSQLAGHIRAVQAYIDDADGVYPDAAMGYVYKMVE
ncbi:MAG: hypothetical protein OHK0039_40630 [Bacteroidia bacterium]